MHRNGKIVEPNNGVDNHPNEMPSLEESAIIKDKDSFEEDSIAEPLGLTQNSLSANYKNRNTRPGRSTNHKIEESKQHKQKLGVM